MMIRKLAKLNSSGKEKIQRQRSEVRMPSPAFHRIGDKVPRRSCVANFLRMHSELP